MVRPRCSTAKARWAAAVDAVGSVTLANVLSHTNPEGTVAACGLAQGMDLPTSVAPFILRGVKLIGVNSVTCPLPRRNEAWRRLAADLDLGGRVGLRVERLVLRRPALEPEEDAVLRLPEGRAEVAAELLNGREESEPGVPVEAAPVGQGG